MGKQKKNPGAQNRDAEDDALQGQAPETEQPEDEGSGPEGSLAPVDAQDDSAGGSEEADEVGSSAGADESDPNVEEPAAETQAPRGPGQLRISNPARAGQAVSGVTGIPVEFDADGIAVVSRPEFEHFLKVPGYREA